MNDQWFQSSTGSGDLALTIKGLLVSLIPLVLVVVRYYNINLDQNDLMQGAQAITGVVACGLVIVGLVRKAANKWL